MWATTPPKSGRQRRTDAVGHQRAGDVELSAPYPEIGADAASWLVMLIEVAAAAALGLAGLRQWSASRAPTPRPG